MTLSPDTGDGLDTPLPCDVEINHIRYRKGVKLRTLVNAARRWHTRISALEGEVEGLKASQSQPGCAEKEPQLQASEPSAAWRPIETAPKDGSWILAFWPSRGGNPEAGTPPDLHVVASAQWAAPNGFVPHWCIEGRWTPGEDPTHWMQMPEAPR